MKRFIRKRPRPGTIIAIIALIVALAGTAVAAGPFLPKRKFVNFKGTVLKGLTYVNTNTTLAGGTYPVGINQTVSAACPSGLKVIGGGVKVPEPGPGPNNDNIFVADSHPTASGWTARVHNYSGLPATATTTAICAKAKKVTGSPPGS